MVYRHEAYLTVIEFSPETMEEFDFPETMSPYMAMRTALELRTASRELGERNLQELADMSAEAEARRDERTQRIERLMLVTGRILEVCREEYEEYVAAFPEDAITPAPAPTPAPEPLIILRAGTEVA